MSKKDMSQIEPQVEEGAVVDGATEAEKLEKFKASKREAAKRFKERRAKEKADRVEGMKKFIERAQSTGTWDKFTDEEKAFLSGIANPAVSGGFNNESTFTKMFGDAPSVGQKITLREAFEKTLKGKANIDKLVKEWAEKGTVVTFTPNGSNVLDGIYTIEALAK